MGRSKPWLLALDLSGPRGMVVLEGEGALFSREVEGGSRVSQLFEAAREAMSEAGRSMQDIGLIGVGRGPGSFTGVRVGVMAAKALSDVLGVPLVAPDSLETLCIEAEGRAERVVVVMDAKRGQVYYGFYRLDKGRPEVEEGPGVAGPEQLAERISAWRGNFADGTAIIGTGLDAFPDAWPSDLPRIEGHSPTPRGLARLCRAYEAEGKFNHPLELLPLYIRRPDARERAAGGKGEGCG